MIRVFTFNLRTEVKEDGVNAFSNRKEFIKKSFFKYDADLIGFQEVRPHMRKWLEDNMAEFQFVGAGRSENIDDESNIIAIRKDCFEVKKTETFWLSETPNIIGSKFEIDQSIYPRICTVVTLLDKNTNMLFRHYNTHLDHLGEMARIKGILVVLDKIKKDNLELELPIILTGDFNATPESSVIQLVKKSPFGLKDVSEVGGTYHSYNPKAGLTKIDYIFTNLPSDGNKSFKAIDEENGVFLSDHYPVCALIDLV